jgi:hypothetical protein
MRYEEYEVSNMIVESYIGNSCSVWDDNRCSTKKTSIWSIKKTARARKSQNIIRTFSGQSEREYVVFEVVYIFECSYHFFELNIGFYHLGIVCI